MNLKNNKFLIGTQYEVNQGVEFLNKSNKILTQISTISPLFLFSMTIFKWIDKIFKKKFKFYFNMKIVKFSY